LGGRRGYPGGATVTTTDRFPVEPECLNYIWAGGLKAHVGNAVIRAPLLAPDFPALEDPDTTPGKTIKEFVAEGK